MSREKTETLQACKAPPQNVAQNADSAVSQVCQPAPATTSSPRAAWFHFSKLCARSHGPAD